tara:strand:- start:3867 stop:5477 length:1611 start_codon:yes stop_codon:yes gene_type:complete
MDKPLMISSLIEHANRVSGDREIVTRSVEGPIHRYTYADAYVRVRKLANALSELGMKLGDRIATLAWNTNRHFECYYAVSGMGGITHTLNPRLSPEQLIYIINHAEDSYIFVDVNLLPLVEAVSSKLRSLKGIIVLTDENNLPESKLDNLICYEKLIDDHSMVSDWPEFDENTASSLCYTSGTTGNPKGALYSHRSTILHAYASALPDVMNLSEKEVVLPVVPMFHVNAWGIPYGATMTGAKLVFPGPKLDGASVHELLVEEEVTMAAGVPTVWLGLLNHWKANKTKVPSLKRTIIGGTAVPQSMIETFQEKFNVDVRHAWGMTEMSPLGTISIPKEKIVKEGKQKRYRSQIKQGRPVFGVEIKIVNDQNETLPNDGKAFGELLVRGPWITSGYFKNDDSDSHNNDGWFATGDVCTIDPEGYMEITDRAKDVIKSGGEWISSIDLENQAMGHPDVMLAAVIGVPHPKWDERPILIVVPTEGKIPNLESINEFLSDKVAKWWLPDDLILVEDLPLGPTGKILKTKLRKEFGQHALPE